MRFREIQLRDAVGTEGEIHNHFTEGEGLSEDTKVLYLTDARGTVGVGVTVVFANGEQWIVPWSNIVGAQKRDEQHA